jgi:hypothetical protein
MSAGRIANIEAVYLPPFYFTGDEITRIRGAERECFLGRAHQREVPYAISEHQRTTRERTQDIDYHDDAAGISCSAQQA